MTDMAAQDAAPTVKEVRTVRVWDPLVRLFHWSLVAAFAVAWLTAEELSTVHEIAGYVVAGLVAFRLVWGLVGSRYARFAQFLRGPGATLSYLGDMARGKERRHLGHNPAGAAMIVALLVTLAGTALTGWLMAEPARLAMLPEMPQIATPAFADEDGEYDEGGKESLEELHEVFANLMLLLVALHVGASCWPRSATTRTSPGPCSPATSARQGLAISPDRIETPRPTVPSASRGPAFPRRGLLLSDGKLKRESPHCQEVLRSDLQIGLSRQ